MFKSKYSNLLTIILVIAIIVILVIATIFVVNVYKKYKNNQDTIKAISDFEYSVNNGTEIQNQGFIEQNVVITSNEEVATSKNGTRKVTYYKNFVMIGYIEIPKIKIKYPILEEETVSSLEQSVAVRYPSNANLNTSGNVVIVGHNYRNGMFFSNLKKVSVGDLVNITDSNGRKLEYTVYEVYTTTPEDVNYMTRNVGSNTEITLVTCTDDGNSRIIVKAKA